MCDGNLQHLYSTEPIFQKPHGPKERYSEVIKKTTIVYNDTSNSH